MNSNDLSHVSFIPGKNPSRINAWKEWIRRVFAHDYFPVLVLIVINLCLGLISANQYGEAIDEQYLYIYGDNTLSFYTRWIDLHVPTSYGPTNLRYYGPAYLLLGTILKDVLRPLLLSWTETDIWHWINLLTFQVGLLFFYSLCRRLTGKWAAFAAVLLFSTQPLLYGHAFINPKDIPFMVFFLAAVSSGVRIVDLFVDRSQETAFHLLDSVDEASGAGWLDLVRQDWKSASRFSKRLLVITCLILVVSLIIWFIGGRSLISSVIYSLYALDPESFLGSLFARAAENAAVVTPEMYILKALGLYPAYACICHHIVLAGNALRMACFLFVASRDMEKNWKRNLGRDTAGAMHVGARVGASSRAACGGLFPCTKRTESFVYHSGVYSDSAPCCISHLALSVGFSC